MRLLVLSALAFVVCAVPLSLNQDNADAVVKTADIGDAAALKGKGTLKDLPVPLGKVPGANMPSEHYPVEKGSQYQIKDTTEVVAAAPVVDPKNKTVFGLQPEPLSFDYHAELHPMEIKTPLGGEFPCDPELSVSVSIPAAEYRPTSSIPYLPLRYGCSDGFEVSREKASPEVRWSNIAFDAQAFSLQIVSMGGPNCPGTGSDAGLILWHIVNITKVAPEMILQEGASHDTRLLKGGLEQPNQWLEEYYSGPCPPPGVTECYRLKVLTHRQSGWCQCGFQDFLFERPAKVIDQPWTYNFNSTAEIAPVGKKVNA